MGGSLRSYRPWKSTDSINYGDNLWSQLHNFKHNQRPNSETGNQKIMRVPLSLRSRETKRDP
eukprot:CAMPEP_0185581370 /NCGR_PEP_ID=MMETSP0434-20130131/18270_1 /TAXON_ID=626734 ORGANISM="Favella taraikaensis, Strain Fe Narragansett Bay" /NCGR_SAMPLE_ID=MMETSP0434 /ASSEMBLY_ACC=CAM_ASM_000379 /LENGTH=61 /DNA_ID=CAMNT_0028199887 /DNA_START=126 /DNA_END=311 /DNA_ORIENTATION=+